MKRKHSLFLCFVLLLLAFPVIKPNVRAQGTHIFVSPEGAGTDCSQAAPCSAATGLGKADDGDTLYFKYGTYKGTTDPIFMVEKAISLIGGWDGSTTIPYTINPRLYETIIDGENVRQLVQIDTSSPEVMQVSGITFKNGEAMDSTANKGGAIWVKDGGILIDSCRFENNKASAYGGAIYVGSDDRFEVKNCQFIGNSVTHGGGAINITRLGASDVALIEDNEFKNNSADYGSAIEIGKSSVTFNANLIANNTASSAILVTSPAKVRITNNIIFWDILGNKNYSAIVDYYEAGEITEVINNTIVNAGRGITGNFNPKMIITNNIFYGCYEGINVTGEHNLSGTNNLFYGNTINTFLLDNPITDQDPLFKNAAMQNYHLKEDSPAIDAGAVVALTDDFDGDERPLDGGYDIGADEFKEGFMIFLPLLLR